LRSLSSEGGGGTVTPRPNYLSILIHERENLKRRKAFQHRLVGGRKEGKERGEVCLSISEKASPRCLASGRKKKESLKLLLAHSGGEGREGEKKGERKKPPMAILEAAYHTPFEEEVLEERKDRTSEQGRGGKGKKG